MAGESKMRIGSRVAISHQNEDGTWERFLVCHAPKLGTVIAVNIGCDMDGYDSIESLTIRWDDGRIENRKMEGEDEKGNWELADFTPQLYANLYLHDREYGGPEEGGWWYDTYTPGDGDWMNDPPPYGHFSTVAEAEDAMEALEAWCEEENKHRRSPSSMASEGHFVARLESWPAEPMPARRPHYC